MTYQVFNIIIGGILVGLLIAGFYTLVQMTIISRNICQNLDAQNSLIDRYSFRLQLMEVMRRKRLDDRAVARLTGASAPTVMDWMEGKSAPHPALMEGILTDLEGPQHKESK